MNSFRKQNWQQADGNESIKIIAETNDYFVFVFDMNHAQVYDKKCLSEEKTNEFREFISEKTGLKILEIK